LITKAILATIMTCLAAYSDAYSENSDALIDSSETEIQAIRDRLEKVRTQISAFQDATKSGSKLRQQMLIDRSLEAAKAAQKNGDHIRVIRELQYYLTATQVPETLKYLQAQSLLAESYRAMGYSSRALRAYRRYLASFITSGSNEYAEVLEVLKSMSSLASSELSQQRQELSDLLSSVSALKFPDHVMAEALYWSARSLIQIGETNLAKTWFVRANELSKDHLLKSRSLYFEAMLALTSKDMDRADQLLSQALVLEHEAKSQEADSIKLALARTAAERGMFKRSQEIYQEIKADSPVHREALFDSIYIKIRMEQYADAAKIARSYLEKYRESKQSIEISNLLGYLSLHEEKFDESRNHLGESLQKLTELRLWVKKLLNNPDRISHEDLIALKLKTNGIANSSPIAERALSQFAALSEHQQGNADLQSDIRSTIVEIGSSRVFEVNPQWQQTSIALSALVNELADIGRRISAVEKHTLESKMSPADKFRMEELNKRRSSLISTATENKWELDQYRGWINNQILISRSQRIFTKAFELNLRMRSADYVASIRGSQGMLPEDFRSKNQLQAEISSAMESVGKLSKVLQTKNIANFVDQSDHQSVRRFLTRYSNLLLEEESLMTKYRDQSVEPATRFRAQSFAETWSQWKFASKSAYEILHRFDKDMQQTVNAMIGSVEDFEKRSVQNQAQIATVKNRLERTLADLSPSILLHYDRQISRKLSRIRKWKGDLESLKFKQMQKEGNDLNAKLDLEREIARASYEAVFERSL
jgi:tetratricopeptide (TPR) repeat protein